MPFVKKCSSQSLHDTIIKDYGNLPGFDTIYTNYVKYDIKKAIFREIGVDLNDLLRRVKFTSMHFCIECLNYITDKYPELQTVNSDSEKYDHCYEASTKKKKPAEVRANYIDLSNIKVDHLTAAERSELAYALGFFESDSVLRQIEKMNYYTKPDNLLESIDIDSYIKEENSTVIAFLHGLGRYPIDNDTPTHKSFGSKASKYILCKTVESIYHYVYPLSMLPFHLRESIILYSATGSRPAVDVISKGSGHISYKTLKSWLESLGTIVVEEQKGDVLVAFDNNQVLNKTWRIRLDSKFRCNVVTMVVVFEIDRKGDFQSDSSLKPGKWMNGQLNEEQMSFLQKPDCNKHVQDMHMIHLNNYLVQRLEKVVNEQNFGDFGWKDNIDIKVEEAENSTKFKKCHNCGCTKVPKLKHNCPECNVNIKQSEKITSNSDAPVHLPSSIETKTVTEEKMSLYKDSDCSDVFVIAAEKIRNKNKNSVFDCKNEGIFNKCHVHSPIIVNPCSYEAVETVMLAIGEKVGITKYTKESKTNKQWVAILCDGVPYVLCKRVIACTFRCSFCRKLVSGKDECNKHTHEDEVPTFTKEFDWVLLYPGPGHIEMNALKALVELTWDVFWKDLIELFNFKSESAQKSAKSVSDFHKGWSLFKIALNSLVDELLVPFVRSVMNTDKTVSNISSAHFIKFLLCRVNDPNYAFIADITLEIMDSIAMYREGIRCADIDVMLCARSKFSKLWYGRNHPLYRELDMSDSVSYQLMPEDVKKFTTSAVSLNKSGEAYSSEGADFRLEEMNQEIQNMLPNKPSENDWKMACINYDKLVQMRKQFFEDAGVKDPKIKLYENRSSSEVLVQEEIAFRTLIRSRKYLSDPSVSRQHISLSGKLLDTNLCQFCTVSRQVKVNYCEAFMQHRIQEENNKPEKVKFQCDPVFITPEEKNKYNAIENQPIKCIVVKIKDMLSKIQNPEWHEAYQSVWQKHLSKFQGCKQNYIEFFHELEDYLSQENDNDA